MPYRMTAAGAARAVGWPAPAVVTDIYRRADARQAACDAVCRGRAMELKEGGIAGAEAAHAMSLASTAAEAQALQQFPRLTPEERGPETRPAAGELCDPPSRSIAHHLDRGWIEVATEPTLKGRKR